MKIAVFGASGKIGSQVVKQLSENGHEVLRIGANRGDYTVDYTDAQAIDALLAT
jgi:uncharacterized protein YbjT (DUF2867 family)